MRSIVVGAFAARSQLSRELNTWRTPSTAFGGPLPRCAGR